METPKFTPVAPAPPPPTVSEHVDLTERISALMILLEAKQQDLAQAKAILKDVVAAGVLTDGFVTNAVAQSLIAQAAVAKKFLEEHP